MIWLPRFDAQLTACRQKNGWRVRQVNQRSDGRWLYHQGRRYLNFSANDYLGLSQHPAVIAAWCEGAKRYGTGSGGSGHITGYHQVHQQLEMALAEWLGYPRALLFISGFAANQAVIHTLVQQGDSIFADKLSHSSLIDAAMASKGQLRRFAHNNVHALAALLAKPCAGGQLVVTEGVFSMDGDRAPLADIASLTQVQHQQALLLVDDAHGIAVSAEQGRGSCASQGIQPDLLVITFGKAFGLSGAALLCSDIIADYFTQFARHLIYSTAMPPAQALALHAALRIIQQQEGDTLRQRLQQNIQQFRQLLGQLAVNSTDSYTAIQPLILGDNQQVLSIAQQLRQQGMWLSAIRPPTVPPGSARLRVTLSAVHQPADIEQLAEQISIALIKSAYR